MKYEGCLEVSSPAFLLDGISYSLCSATPISPFVILDLVSLSQIFYKCKKTSFLSFMWKPVTSNVYLMVFPTLTVLLPPSLLLL